MSPAAERSDSVTEKSKSKKKEKKLIRYNALDPTHPFETLNGKLFSTDCGGKYCNTDRLK